MARRSRRPGIYSVNSVLDRITAICDDVAEAISGGSIDEQAHGLLLRCSEAQRQIESISHLLGDELHDEIRSSLTEMVSQLRIDSSSSSIPYRVTATEHTGQRGRPLIRISSHQIDSLLGLGFTVPQIAELLGVSVSTVTRRLRTYGLSVRQTYSVMSDQQLNELVRRISCAHPNAGYRFVCSLLATMGHRVPERRVRDCLRRVDPVSVAYRHSRRGTVDRRQYSVPYPNALWHVDGNMSLIRWGFVVHGAIDGYSRLITYLHCSTNNRSETVLRQFIQAGEQFGYPSRTRSDMGGENIQLAHFMVLLRGENRGSHLTGRSVHNQRIERLWRDVFTESLSLFYHLFHFMENERILDCENEDHLFALQYVFAARINSSLDRFQSAWNAHPIRTERNLTPNQLWVSGMLRHFDSNHLAVQELFNPEDERESTNREDVEDYEIEQTLYSQIDPLRHSSVWGIDIYVEFLQSISR